MVPLQLGVVYLEQGKPSQALAYLDKALDFEPEHTQALLNSAIVLSELGDPSHRPIARQRLLTLLTRDSKNERAFFHLGMLAMDERDAESAEKYFRQAIQLKVDFRRYLPTIKKSSSTPLLTVSPSLSVYPSMPICNIYPRVDT